MVACGADRSKVPEISEPDRMRLWTGGNEERAGSQGKACW